MFGNFKISHVAQNILPLTKSQGYSGDEIKSKKGTKERKERNGFKCSTIDSNKIPMFLDPILCSQQKQRCFSKLKICSIRLPEDKQIKIKYTDTV